MAGSAVRAAPGWRGDRPVEGQGVRTTASDDAYTRGLPVELSLAAGQEISFPLHGGMRSGYTWSLTVDGDAVDAAIVVVPPPLSGEPRPPSPSSPFATERLDLTARRPGSTRVVLRLARSWQSGSELAVHHLHVTVPGDDPGDPSKGLTR